MTAADLVGELETITNRLDEMSEDGYFTARQKVLLEDAARRVAVVFEEAMDNV